MHFTSASALPALISGIDLAGVLLNGVLGGIIARSRQFDAVGFAILAIISALGGGMLRDTLLQHGPPAALTNPYYLGAALAGAAIAFVLRLRGKWVTRAITIADAVVLGCWAASGTAITLGAGFGVIPALMLGMTTAVGGAIIRDVIVGQVPAVFGGNTLYATAALSASATMLVVQPFAGGNIGICSSIIVGAGLSLLARWRRWQLPQHSDWTAAAVVRRIFDNPRRRTE